MMTGKIENYIDSATGHYLTALLWTTSCLGTAADHHGDCRGEDCDTGLLDMNFDVDDFTDDARRSARADVADFVRANWLDLRPTDNSRFWGSEQCGHDFLLTRCGHGVGFWDRGEGERGRRLADAARVYGDTDAWVTADGKVEIQ